MAPLPAAEPMIMHGYAGWAATPVNPNLQRSLDEKCPVCKEMGHWYHDCPKNLCYICKDRGHWQNDCPLRLIMTDEELAHRKSPSNMCYLCGDYGHWQQECPHRPKEFLTADAPAPGPWRVEVVPKHSLKRKQQTDDDSTPAKEPKGPVTPPGTPPPPSDLHHLEPCC